MASILQDVVDLTMDTPDGDDSDGDLQIYDDADAVPVASRSLFSRRAGTQPSATRPISPPPLKRTTLVVATTTVVTTVLDGCETSCPSKASDEPANSGAHGELKSRPTASPGVSATPRSSRQRLQETPPSSSSLSRVSQTPKLPTPRPGSPRNEAPITLSLRVAATQDSALSVSTAMPVTPSRSEQPNSVTPKSSAPKLSMPSKSERSKTLAAKAPTSRSTHPPRSDWTVDGLATALRGFSHQVEDNHAKLVHHSLNITFRRPIPGHAAHLSSFDDFADLVLQPVDASVGVEGMRFKLKQHGRENSRGKQDQQTVRYQAVSLKSGKESVPKYRFHHVEIARNILTPNTMLKFVPHLRDILGKSEEKLYESWLDELTGLDSQSGFKTMSRTEKIAKTIKDETAEMLSWYVDRWLRNLGLEGWNKTKLLRCLAGQISDKGEAGMNPENGATSGKLQDTDLGSPRSVKTAKMFAEAFNRVWNAPSRKEGAVTLWDVLGGDTSVEMLANEDAKRPKESPKAPKSREAWLNAVEYFIASFSIMECLICAKYSCDHGEYDNENQRWNLYSQVDGSNKLGSLLEQRWAPRADGLQNLTPSKLGAGLCKNQCYRSYDTGNINMSVEEWSEKEEMLLRGAFIALGNSPVKVQCLVAPLLGRKCWEVFRKLKELQLSSPYPDVVPEPPKVRSLHWYDRKRKMLLGDWQEQTVTHEHAKRELLDPCHHDGPCSAANNCPCVEANVLCERFCRCTADNCAYKFTGCACHSSGKSCTQRQKEGRPCICVQLNRECDPKLCKSCGARERADPLNAHDHGLHSTGCQNCVLQRGVGKTVLLGKSQLEGCGYGLFTAEDIAHDEFIIEYKGELITHDEGVRREARRGDVFDEGSSSSYLFTLLEQEGIWVDAAVYGNLSRYINHNEEKGCNITPKILYVNGEFRIRFSAIREIRAGEELFFNYGENFPNLTKKLLDNKDNESTTGVGASAEKKRTTGVAGGHPSRPTARTTSKRDNSGVGAAAAVKRPKQKGQARKQAPDPSASDSMDWENDEDGPRDLEDEAEDSDGQEQQDEEPEDEVPVPVVEHDDDDEMADEFVPGRRPGKSKPRRKQTRKRGTGRTPGTSREDAEPHIGANDGKAQQSTPPRRGRGGRRRGAGRKPRADREVAVQAQENAARSAAVSNDDEPPRLRTTTTRSSFSRNRVIHTSDSEEQPLGHAEVSHAQTAARGQKRKADDISAEDQRPGADETEAASRRNGQVDSVADEDDDESAGRPRRERQPRSWSYSFVRWSGKKP